MILGYITCGDHSPINIIRENHKFPCEVYPVTGTANSRNFEKHRAAKAEALKKAEELYNDQSSQPGKGMDRLSDCIDVDLLESLYLNQIHKMPDGKNMISVGLAEKLMLLEIYKKICLGNNGVNDNTNNTNSDSND